MDDDALIVLGWRNSFGYSQVGGIESLIRRTARAWVARGGTVTLLRYDMEEARTAPVADGVVERDVRSLAEVFAILDAHAGPVLINGVHRRHRLALAWFRKRRRRPRLHALLSCYSESWLRRQLFFAEPLLHPYAAPVLAVSPRLARAARRRRAPAEVFLPPVADVYFGPRPPREPDAPIRITFFGRIDPGKGVEEVLELFRRLRRRGGFEVQVHGYSWPHDAATRDLEARVREELGPCYHPSQFSGWYPELEGEVAAALRATDVLVLPYAQLSSTVDVPLLLVEGMAAGCAVLTKRLGDMPWVYGESQFTLPSDRFVERAEELLLGAGGLLRAESRRVTTRARELELDEAGTRRRVERVFAAPTRVS